MEERLQLEARVLRAPAQGWAARRGGSGAGFPFEVECVAQLEVEPRASHPAEEA